CLIEAGGAGDGLLVRTPLLVATMVSGRPKLNNWAFETAPQPGLNNRRGYQPRGKALGGSSAINAMLYVRGQAQDYEGWAAEGATGWGWEDVLPYFRKSENNARGASALHGDEGPLHVADQQSPLPISHAFLEAAEAAGVAPNADFNGPHQEGAGLYQVTQFHDAARRGERCSTAAAYLHPLEFQRPNLTQILRAHVTRITLAEGRATGLTYRKMGADFTVKARREVILSAGTFGSPQLLMLSGIGPGAHLQQKGIAVAHHLPGVGENLQDHIDYITAFRSPRRDVVGLTPGGLWRAFAARKAWQKDGSGLVASPLAEAGAFLKSHAGASRPDLQLHFVIGIADDHMRKLHYGYGFSCHVCALRPASRGTLRLRDAEPLSAPRIQPNSLSEEEDIATLLRAARLMRRLLAQPALAPWRGAELYPLTDDSDAALTDDIRNRADSIYHPVGTCRMGAGSGAVVGPDLTVHGIANLRVVDASVMPRIPSGNTNAPTIMIAEKAADIIRGR
ncbi:MAG: GMC family oxidoreductase N-terminal domain-containing protein, partial [Pseudomonadota bacterium]